MLPARVSSSVLLLRLYEGQIVAMHNRLALERRH
jgi:hypothetical protein